MTASSGIPNEEGMMAEIICCCSRRTCGLVGNVGLFSTSLWACRYIVRRFLGYFMCGGTNSTIFFSVKLNFPKEKMAVSSRAVDYWTDDAVQQCFSVLVRWYDALKTRKKTKRNPILVAVKTHVAAPASTNSQKTCSETSSRRVVCFLCVNGTCRDWRWCRVR